MNRSGLQSPTMVVSNGVASRPPAMRSSCRIMEEEKSIATRLPSMVSKGRLTTCLMNSSESSRSFHALQSFLGVPTVP